MDRSGQITTFNRFTRVSRETITSLKKYEDILIKANKTLNLIGNSTIKDIWTRHFLDSVQVIDLIDKNRIDAAIINANDDLSIMSAKIAEELNIINPILKLLVVG